MVFFLMVFLRVTVILGSCGTLIPWEIFQCHSKSKKTLPFIASVQHVKKVDMMPQCDECDL